MSTDKQALAVADLNRSRKLAAVRKLQKLLELAEDPSFKGCVTIEVNAAGGKLSPAVSNIRQIEPE